TSEDHPLPAKDYVKQMVEKVKEECDRLDYPLPEVWIEPGRSIVAEAGTSLYTVGSRKDVEGVRNFVAVDGGMGDNIRPALYGAKYNAFLANRALDDLTETVTLVGKYCESGDKLIEDLKLPKVKRNDLVAMTTTGAYGYSMASNYNRNQKPAVVFVENGKTQLVVKRETIEDVARFDLDLK
ncbi:diaminopimelate decarboxylase family protein, partial [Vagococcus fluvialis]